MEADSSAPQTPSYPKRFHGTPPHPSISANTAALTRTSRESTQTPATAPAFSVATAVHNATLAGSNPSDLFLELDSTSYLPTPQTGGNETIINKGRQGDAAIKVSVPWHTVTGKLVEHDNLLFSLLNYINSQPNMRTSALNILTNGTEAEPAQTRPHDAVKDQQDGGMQSGDALQAPSPPMAAQSYNVAMSTPAHPAPYRMRSDFETARDYELTRTPMTPSVLESARSSSVSPASAVPYHSPLDYGNQPYLDSLSLASSSSPYPPTPSGFPGFNPSHSHSYSASSISSMASSAAAAHAANNAINSFPAVVTAPVDTIDSEIVAQVETNNNPDEYIWSPQDASLYEIGNSRAMAAMNQPGSIRMVFPPKTMIMAWEKDGSLASPAFRPLHPHSNQWLKAQVCNHRCAYRAGTNTLKRPITIRDHFRKCVYLDEHHPLKVLCTLELAAHERTSQGLLPNRRRSQTASRAVRKSPAKGDSSSFTTAAISRRKSFAVTRGLTGANLSPSSRKKLASPFSGDSDDAPPESSISRDFSSADTGDDAAYEPSDSDEAVFKTPLRPAPYSVTGRSSTVPNGHVTPISMPQTPMTPYGQQQQQVYPHLQPYPSTLQNQPAHPSNYMLHTRRHTMPDTRFMNFSGGLGAPPAGPLVNQQYASAQNLGMPFDPSYTYHQQDQDYHAMPMPETPAQQYTGPFTSMNGNNYQDIDDTSPLSSLSSSDDELLSS